jgi:hypothetical protein
MALRIRKKKPTKAASAKATKAEPKLVDAGPTFAPDAAPEPFPSASDEDQARRLAQRRIGGGRRLGGRLVF